MSLTLSGLSGMYMADVRHQQLTAWQALSPTTRKGFGAELEFSFWKELGYASIPRGDARRAALETVFGSSLQGATTADRELEFWRNGAAVINFRVTDTGDSRITNAGDSRITN